MNTIASPNKIAHFITQPAPLLALVLTVAAISIAYTYQRLTLPLTEQTQTTQSAPGSTATAGLSSTEIIAMDLFGVPSVAAQSSQNHQDIPETKLKLILKGAFSHSDPEQASALIATDQRKRAELFLTGDELPGNAVLEEVYPDYVVLKRGIQLEKLLFFRNQAEIEGQSKGSAYKTPIATQQTPLANEASQNTTPASQTSNNDESAAPPSLPTNEDAPKSLYDIRERLRSKK